MSNDEAIALSSFVISFPPELHKRRLRKGFPLLLQGLHWRDARVYVERVSQAQGLARVDHNLARKIERGAHPAIVADVEGCRMMRIVRMIQERDPFARRGRDRPGIIHPARGLAEAAGLIHTAF